MYVRSTKAEYPHKGGLRLQVSLWMWEPDPFRSLLFFQSEMTSSCSVSNRKNNSWYWTGSVRSPRPIRVPPTALKSGSARTLRSVDHTYTVQVWSWSVLSEARPWTKSCCRGHVLCACAVCENHVFWLSGQALEQNRISWSLVLCGFSCHKREKLVCFRIPYPMFSFWREKL